MFEKKKPDLFRLYIYFYIFLFIYIIFINTQWKKAKVSDWQGEQRFFLFQFLFFSFLFFLIFIQTSLFCSFAFTEYYYWGKQHCYSTRTIWSWVESTKLIGKSPALTKMCLVRSSIGKYSLSPLFPDSTWHKAVLLHSCEAAPHPSPFDLVMMMIFNIFRILGMRAYSN